MKSSELSDDLFDSVAADFMARLRQGEHPGVDEYCDRYPELASEIRELFPTIIAVERMKVQREYSSNGRASLGPRRVERLGDFRIIREIGRGGMGVVYEAEQESLGRRVAVKVLPPHSLLDELHVRRFQREAQTAAALHHTNIVPVFGVGEEDGLHYYVMQLIEGRGLDQWLKSDEGKQIDLRLGVDYVRQIASAVQYAHEQGVLHRDIKPANLLLDTRGNVWITDFGLARALECDETRTDHLGGTLRYMAPERLRGQTDERSDQYSLGITLYELVTGTRAYEGSSSGELLGQISERAPVPARTLNSAIPRDLETIIDRAIARDPQHRYPSVREFSEDLQLFLEQRPIRARRITAVERLWRWSRRNPALALSLSSVAVLLVAVAVVSAALYWQSSRMIATTRQLNTDLSESLRNERDAVEKERSARVTAESILNLALEALDSVFAQFAPDGNSTTIVTVEDSTVEAPDEQLVIVPVEHTPTREIASALEQLLPFYQRLAEETGQDSYVRAQAAMAQHRMGLIQRQLGRSSEALDALRHSQETFQELQQSAPADMLPTRLELARMANDLGDLERTMFNFREARRAHQRALDLLEDPLSSSSRDIEEQIELARTHTLLGKRELLFGWGARGPRGPRRDAVGDRTADRSAGEEQPRRVRRNDRDSRSSREEREGRSRGRAGDNNRIPEVGWHLARAIEILESFPESTNDTRVTLLLARSYRERSTMPPRDRSSEDWHRAIALLTGLVDVSPGVREFRFELAQTYADVEPRWTPDESLEEVRTRLLKARELFGTLVRESPDVPMYAFSESQVLYKLATIHRRLDEPVEAEAALRDALALQPRFERHLPDSSLYAVWEVRLAHALADLMLSQNRLEEATEVLLAATELSRFVSDESERRGPADFFAARTLSETYSMLADLMQDAGRPEAAADYRSKAAKLDPRGRFRNRSGPGSERRRDADEEESRDVRAVRARQ